MKLIVAYIQPHRLEDVKQSLFKADVGKLSVTNSLGCGAQMGYEESYRGVKFDVWFIHGSLFLITFNS